ncbi:sulfite exporter TauE/SafE family protein, partial [Vibrio parahaemolyticus V-223/04]
AVASKSVV